MTIDLEKLVPMPEPYGYAWHEGRVTPNGGYVADFGFNTSNPPEDYGAAELFTAAQMSAMRSEVAREVAKRCAEICAAHYNHEAKDCSEEIAAEFGLEQA